MPSTLREARLRPQYTSLYPGLPAGVWVPAAEAAEHVIAVVRGERGRLGLRGRVPADEHFDFRGGEPAAPRPPEARTRRTDAGAEPAGRE
jgi:hypothetical protein